MENNIIKSEYKGQKAADGWLLAPGKKTSVSGLRTSDFRESSLRYAALLRERRFGLRSSVFGLLALIFSSVLFSSCEDVIEVKLNDENLNLFGVEASITTQEEPTVFLYKTLKVDQDEAYPGVSGAVVTISDNMTPANSVSMVEDQQIKGFYRVPQNKSYLGVAGREYTLTIQAQGVTLTAKDKLTKVEPIDSIQIFPSMRGNKLFLGVFSYGKETQGLGNFYKWDVYINDTLVHNADRLAVASDEFVDGNYISKLEIYTDFHDPNKPQDRKINLNDKIQIKQTSISEFAYNFYFQMINQGSTGSLFSVPSANIKSNFTSSDGKPVLGLFVARDVSVSNSVVIDQAIEDQLRKP